MAWDEDKKAAVIAAYEEANPTEETSGDIVKELADEYNESPNGVRMILSKAGVYIKKGTAAKPTKGGGTGGTRVSKQASQDALVAAIQDAGQKVDEDVISKLTGKAAVYLTEIISALAK